VIEYKIIIPSPSPARRALFKIDFPLFHIQKTSKNKFFIVILMMQESHE
jgi:hypothetical protein